MVSYDGPTNLKTRRHTSDEPDFFTYPCAKADAGSCLSCPSDQEPYVALLKLVDPHLHPQLQGQLFRLNEDCTGCVPPQGLPIGEHAGIAADTGIQAFASPLQYTSWAPCLSSALLRCFFLYCIRSCISSDSSGNLVRSQHLISIPPHFLVLTPPPPCT